MKIENMGVKITGVHYLGTIEINTDGIVIGGSFRERVDVEEMRDALTEALRQYDAMTATAEPAPIAPTPGLAPGQRLDGTETLPDGAVVQDADGENWCVIPSGNLTLRTPRVDDFGWTLARLVDEYAPVHIVSLP